MNLKYKTTECVSAGHPDKVADVIADSILDACLLLDPKSKVACEVMVKDDVVVLGGEITTNCNPESLKIVIECVVNECVGILGYTRPELKFCRDRLKIINLISKQSPEINNAVVGDGNENNIGAGDQGIMWGYATNETPNYMPLGMFLARGINQAMRPLDWDVLFADCKTQVTIAYDEENKPIRVSHVVISCLHHPEYSIQYVRSAMENRFLGFVANLVRHNLSYLFDDKLELILNHAGSWTFGGPAADTGVTGRKIVVDAYGADCEVGGGAFSGKDGTKVDRSGAYAARYIAKNIVSAGLAKECKVQLGYVIGQKEPVSFNIDFMNTGLVKGFTEREAEKAIRNLMSLTPGALIERFRLKEPMFQKTAMYGHFGIPSYPWEDTSLAHKLKKQ